MSSSREKTEAEQDEKKDELFMRVLVKNRGFKGFQIQHSPEEVTEHLHRMAKDTATFILTEATSAISEHPENKDDREFKELFTLLESKLPDS